MQNKTKLICPKCNKQYTLKSGVDAKQKLNCRACGTELRIVPESAVPIVKPSSGYDKTILADSSTKTSANPPSEKRKSTVSKMTPFLTNLPHEVDEALASEGNLIAEKYVIISKIGRGGMGSVYKAWDVTLKRYAAIKMILSAVIAETERNDDSRGEVIGRFFREAQTSAKLIHPNILQVYEIGKQDENHYIAMEYVDGGTLDELWEQKHVIAGKTALPARKDITDYISLMKEISRAVDFAHQYNIIHRDIKPSNILLSKGQQEKLTPKIADFGLAKEITSGSEITIAGTIVGTPSFMSPEQARTERLDARSDIFSLGSVLYKLCTGKEPFEGDSYLDTIKSVVNKEPARPGAVNKSVDNDLETIILKTLEKDKNHRYAGAGELADDLERYLQGEPIKARPASSFYKLTKKIKKNKFAAAGVIFGIAVLLASLILFGFSNLHRKGQADEYREKADSLYAQQKFKEANDFYVKLLELDKDNTHALGRLKEYDNMVIAEHEASKEAEDAWMQASAVFTEFYKKDADMGKVWIKVDGAIDKIGKAIKKYPVPMAYVYRAMLYREKEQMIAAENDLSEVINKHPDFDIARIMRAMIKIERLSRSIFGLEQQDRIGKTGTIMLTDIVKEAAEDFAKIKPDAKLQGQFEVYGIILSEYQRTFSQGKKFDYTFVDTMLKGFEKYNSEEFLLQAILIDPKEETIDKIIDLKPQSARAYFLRGVTRRIKKNFPGSIEALDKALQINPTFYVAYGERAVAKHMSDELDGAIADYEIFVKYFSKYSTAHTDLGAIYTKKGDYKKAIEEYDQAIKLKPENNMAYRERGFAKAKANDFDGAIADFTRALAFDPKDAESYRDRSFAKSKKKDNAGAIADMDAAINLKEDNPDFYLERGLRHMDNHGFNEALDDYNTAVRLKPDFAEAYSNRALMELELGDFDKAIEDCGAALQLKPDLSDAYINRAAAKEGKKDYIGAIADYDETIRLKPDSAVSYSMRGLLKKRTGDLAGAIEDYTKAIEKDEKNEEAYNNRGVALYDLNRLDEAVRDYNRALKLNPEFADAYSNRGVARQRKKDFDGAIEDSTKAIVLNPKYTLAYYNRGLAKKEKGDFHGAIADYNQALKLAPDMADVYYERGFALIDIGDLDGALKDMDRAIELNPMHPRAYYERSYVKKNKNDLDGAFEDLEKSIRMDPSHADSWYGHGKILSMRGDTAGAIEDYTKAIQNNVAFVDAYLARAFSYSAIRKYAEAIADYTEVMEISPQTRNELETVIRDLQNRMQE
ncbi:MAG: tetratricopeptide repeat protein [Planctomycetes bacterium]|nr:tetratricopeptide repeat protein [Planctomycetota bacterium]